MFLRRDFLHTVLLAPLAKLLRLERDEPCYEWAEFDEPHGRPFYAELWSDYDGRIIATWVQIKVGGTAHWIPAWSPTFSHDGALQAD